MIMWELLQVHKHHYTWFELIHQLVYDEFGVIIVGRYEVDEKSLVDSGYLQRSVCPIDR